MTFSDPGTTTIQSRYDVAETYEIGGPAPGDDFDQLVVSGQATLDGTLKVSLVNGFTPASGDTFQILTAGVVTGGFANLDLDPAFLDPLYDP